MKIAMIYQNNPPFTKDTHNELGLGGSESGFIRTAEYLVKMGHTVNVFNFFDGPRIDYGNGLTWANYKYFDRSLKYDIVYSLRHREAFEKPVNAKLRVLFLADTESIGLGNFFKEGKIDLVMGVSHWQTEKISREEGIAKEFMMVTSNGIMPADTNSWLPKVPGRCLFLATPDRLGSLLDVWPSIHEQVPGSELHVYSSFMGWTMPQSENDTVLKDLYDRMATIPGLINKKHGNPEEIRREQQEAVLYLYPSDYKETCCMSVLESMLHGCVPIVSGQASLLEKVTHGITGYVIPVYGDSSPRYKDMFIKAAVKVLKDGTAHAKGEYPDGEWSDMSKNCVKFANNFTYDVLVPQWVEEWNRRIAEKGL